MGIYDRDYYRNDSRGMFSLSMGQVSKWLIIVNVIAFAIQVIAQDQQGLRGEPVDRFTNSLVFDSGQVMEGQVWRALTCAFLHSGIWHIVFNMFALWWFGKEVEDIYGPKEFLAFYVVAAVWSSVAFGVVDLVTHQPGAQFARMLGASGAVTACLVVFALHYPRRLIYLFGIVPMPALAFVVLFVALDAFGMLGGMAGSNVAFAAHLGGALFGFLYYRFQWRVTALWPGRMSMRPRRKRPKLRVYREPVDEEPVPVPANSARADEALEAQLDAVLEKVARQGRSSLNERENQILLKASEIYKHKRK